MNYCKLGMTLAGLALTATSWAAPTIERLWPEKLVWRPGETARFEITIHNPDPRETRLTLQLRLVTDLDMLREVREQAVRLGPRETRVFTVAVDLNPEDAWGYEVQARLLDPGEAEPHAIAAARDFFLVAGDID